jgi:hypothetical protein
MPESGWRVPHEPNPKRIAAGRLNRAKRGPLTEDGRKRLRASALTNKPWRFATGPRTAEGKAVSAANGRYGQTDERSIRESRNEVAQLLAMVANFSGLDAAG